MAGALYSTVAFNPFPVLVSGQTINDEGSNLDALTTTEITWDLSTAGGTTSVGGGDIGAVRLAIPLGREQAALLQNTAHVVLPTAAEQMTSPDASIYVIYDRASFQRDKLMLSVRTGTDFCPYATGSPSCSEEPACLLSASSAQLHLILTVATQDGAPLPLAEISDLTVTLANCFTSALPGESMMRLLRYGTANGAVEPCPTGPVIDLPVTKLSLEPGVSDFRAEPRTQFLAGADAPKAVTLRWAFSQAGVTGISPTGTLRIGRQGEAPESVALDTEALHAGSHQVTPRSGITFAELDYVLAGQGSGQELGGTAYTEFNVVAETQSLINPVFGGTARMLGRPQGAIAAGSYVPDGDGYLLCVLNATGAPTGDPPTPQSYVQITQGETVTVVATRLEITAPRASNVSASMTQTTAQLVPVRGGTAVAIAASGTDFSCTWLPIGEATLTAQ